MSNTKTEAQAREEIKQLVAEYYKKYNEVAVFEPTNKHYKELVKILKNPVFQDKEHCFLEARLFDIANS